jgi:hypothetical protein
MISTGWLAVLVLGGVALVVILGWRYGDWPDERGASRRKRQNGE